MKRRMGKKRKSGKAAWPLPARPSPNGATRVIDLQDHLGFLVPPSMLTEGAVASSLFSMMDQKRFRAGLGIPSIPTRYVVTMNPADRAWLNPFAEDRIAAALTRHAESCGLLIVGDVVVEFECDDAVAQGMPRYWAGFAEDDLLVLADPTAAAEVFSRN